MVSPDRLELEEPPVNKEPLAPLDPRVNGDHQALSVLPELMAPEDPEDHPAQPERQENEVK